MWFFITRWVKNFIKSKSIDTHASDCAHHRYAEQIDICLFIGFGKEMCCVYCIRSKDGKIIYFLWKNIFGNCPGNSSDPNDIKNLEDFWKEYIENILLLQRTGSYLKYLRIGEVLQKLQTLRIHIHVIKLLMMR